MTEQGILRFFMNLPKWKDENAEGGDAVYQAKSNFETNGSCLAVVEFSSSRKRASVAVKRSDGSVRVFTKGAPDRLFPMLTGVLDSNMNV